MSIGCVQHVPHHSNGRLEFGQCQATRNTFRRDHHSVLLLFAKRVLFTSAFIQIGWTYLAEYRSDLHINRRELMAVCATNANKFAAGLNDCFLPFYLWTWNSLAKQTIGHYVNCNYVFVFHTHCRDIFNRRK